MASGSFYIQRMNQLFRNHKKSSLTFEMAIVNVNVGQKLSKSPFFKIMHSTFDFHKEFSWVTKYSKPLMPLFDYCVISSFKSAFYI